MGYDTVHLKIMPWIFPELQTFLYLPANGIIQGMRPIIAFNYGAAHHRAGCISAAAVLSLIICRRTAGTN